jgi:hypothetical protein
MDAGAAGSERTGAFVTSRPLSGNLLLAFAAFYYPVAEMTVFRE